MEVLNENKLIQLLLSRLEHISVDSYWAHRASGVRGALLKILDETDMVNDYHVRLDELITTGFNILHQAAKENERGSGIPNRFFR